MYKSIITFILLVSGFIISSGFKSSSIKVSEAGCSHFQETKNLHIKGNPEKILNQFYQCCEISDNLNTLSEYNVKDEYKFVYNSEFELFNSYNRQNNLRFIVSGDGFTTMPGNINFTCLEYNNCLINNFKKWVDNSEDWSIRFRIVDSEYELKNSRVINSGNEVFSENGNIRVNYTNSRDGMRQDFIIKKKPKQCGYLNFLVSAETNLKMIVEKDAVLFKDKNGRVKLKYSSLKCWDAKGNILESFFKSNLEYSGNLFSIIVNDSNAVYPITIDPLSSSPDWQTESNQSEAQLGFDVATAGDINNDGYSDIIIGAPFFDNGKLNKGRVYLYYGSMFGMSEIADFIIESSIDSANFGISVSTAGDINGDGYSDILIGAENYNDKNSTGGRVFVYFGSAKGILKDSPQILYCNQPHAAFGKSVSTAGDVNGDGYSDVLIGAPDYNNGQNNEGKVFLYFGSNAGLSNAADWTSESNMANSYFGISVNTAGDINSDGFSDIIIGAQFYDNGQKDEGCVFAFYGSEKGLGENGNPDNADWKFEGNQMQAFLGVSVSAAGDVNGDGFCDILIGASGYDNSQKDEGRAYLFNGSSSGLGLNPSWVGEINANESNFGESVFMAGDVNGDGYSDVVIGAPKFDSLNNDEGRVFVYFGSPSGLRNTADWSTGMGQKESEFGNSVATAGDINGDGFSDILIGSRLFDNSEVNEGIVIAFHGKAEGLSYTSNQVFNSTNHLSYFGYSISSAGDVNGDGYSDVIIGAPYFDNGNTNEGKVFVYFGSQNGISPLYGWTSEGNQESCNFGYSVNTAGDVNGDGFSDVIIGAPNFDNGYSNQGKVFLYLGSKNGLSLTESWTASGNFQDDWFGYCVSSAGDINGDGFSDVIIGQPNSSEFGITGKVWLFNGTSSGLTVYPVWSGSDNQKFSNFGSSVSSAGDINGDGYSDIIVGAKNFTNNEENEGAVFLYNGSESGLSLLPDWRKEFNEEHTYFGNCVSSAGDVNADGFHDVLICANYYSNDQLYEGAVFSFYGSSQGLSQYPDWIAEGNNSYTFFGSSSAAAGDVNGDGYSDIIIGSHFYSNGQEFEGAALSYYGSPSGISENADWIVESNLMHHYYGHQVSSAGDVNGDGYSDIITGSFFMNNYYGKVFTYYGNESTGKNSVIMQLNSETNRIIYSGGYTNSIGEIRLSAHAKSFYGKTIGRMLFEISANSSPFSGEVITNSTLFTGYGDYSDLGISGSTLLKDIKGLTEMNLYKWRSRIQFKTSSNPFQSLSPWKYYYNYIPYPSGDFKAKSLYTDFRSISLKACIQGRYNNIYNKMIGDTISLFIRSIAYPYAKVDSVKTYLDSNFNSESFFYNNAIIPNSKYYLQIIHRNSIETWTIPALITDGEINFDLRNSDAAYGNNQIIVNNNPVMFAIYSGDVNQDGFIDGTDSKLIDNDIQYFISGYVSTDLTGDFIVDGSDALIAENNSSEFIGVIRP